MLGSMGCGTPPESDTTERPFLFELLPAERTNITFANTLSEAPGVNRNVLMYEYFYNGAGVAVGDVNGDGLDDAYFVGNMSYNKLYLNRGNLEFEDVTEMAGVRGRKNTWSTGVAMADVNGDGRLDIYVCYSGQLPDDRKVDELYINQGPDDDGVPRFDEQAEEYGLANPHSSNSVVLFDFDRDTDLDLLLVNHNDETLPVLSEEETRKLLENNDPVNGIRLYRNDGGMFRDVTRQAGIASSPLTYGLAAGASDLNNDGWLDLYVSNDFSPPDYLYINNRDGTFTDSLSSLLGHTSYASMGVDIADMNNDGWTDIYVLDMLAEDNRRQKLLHVPTDRDHFAMNVRLGFHHQYMRNMLHLNHGNATFSEIGQLAGISNTDWSWTPLLADYDNDGWKDIFVTNGMPHDITDRDYMAFEARYVRQRNSNLSSEDVMLLLAQLPSTEVANYAFRNNGNLTFEDVSRKWGLSRSLNSHGAAYSDLDNDGDLDLITNNLNSRASIFKNFASERLDHHFLRVQLEGIKQNTMGVGTKVILFAGDQRQVLEQLPMRGYLSSVSPVLHFGLGDRETIDSLRVVWPDGRKELLRDIAADQSITVRQADASAISTSTGNSIPLFKQVESPIPFHHEPRIDYDDFERQPFLLNPKSFSGPALAASDVNSDGLTDVFVGGAESQSGKLYLQQQNGDYNVSTTVDFELHRASHDVEAVFFDATADGHPDLYVASGGYGGFKPSDPRLQDRLYVNDGKGGFSANGEALPEMTTSTGAVAVGDINGDGNPDIFIGGRVVPGRYPVAPRSYVLINDGRGRFADRTAELARDLDRLGMITDAIWSDLGGDGVTELIVVGEWMPISIFRIEDGILRNRTSEYIGDDLDGLWNTITAADLNGDGRSDLIAGNFGLNSQLTASSQRPAELHYGDFDSDGVVDPLLFSYVQDESYPFPTLDELTDEIPSIRSSFPTYESYAEATQADVLEELQHKSPDKLHVNFLKTALFLSDADRRLRRADLPIQVQMAPVFAISDLDFNSDGAKDLILAGNIHDAPIRFGKYDANYGILLKGNGEGGFEYVPQIESGFRLRGDVRSILELQDNWIFGVYGQKLEAYRVQHRPPS